MVLILMTTSCKTNDYPYAVCCFDLWLVGYEGKHRKDFRNDKVIDVSRTGLGAGDDRITKQLTGRGAVIAPVSSFGLHFGVLRVTQRVFEQLVRCIVARQVKHKHSKVVRKVVIPRFVPYDQHTTYQEAVSMYR